MNKPFGTRFVDVHDEVLQMSWNGNLGPGTVVPASIDSSRWVVGRVFLGRHPFYGHGESILLAKGQDLLENGVVLPPGFTHAFHAERFNHRSGVRPHTDDLSSCLIGGEHSQTQLNCHELRPWDVAALGPPSPNQLPCRPLVSIGVPDAFDRGIDENLNGRAFWRQQECRNLCIPKRRHGSCCGKSDIVHGSSVLFRSVESLEDEETEFNQELVPSCLALGWVSYQSLASCHQIVCQFVHA
ncbi:hypothetical protein DFP72DRAFT_504340 [Ephemerocybe angulata]|uniref:Uncharacterized protein n=1 Tax=Ephemerocybe angulata TaxID=980116 RepID=A0A8H6M433_9AGAR|nr:hypothetical protein DFP72DRAFT_504340 [Tulosesus angulatus]